MKKIYLIATAALALTACDNHDDSIVPLSSETLVSASIGESLSTRARDNSWEDGDEIGVTTTVVNGVRKQVNFKYSTDGGERFIGNPLYFYKPMVVTAYYPFKGPEGTAPGIISANTDVGQQTPGNQPAIDFLWDQQTQIHVVDNKPEVHFNFAHKMCKLTLVFKNGNDGTDVSKAVSYRIDGLVLNGTFNPETGVCAADSDDPRSLSVDLSDVTVSSGSSLAPLILFPQNPGIGRVSLHIYSNEVNDADALQYYNCTLDFDNGELKPGKNYQYTINVSKAGLKLEKTSITDWIDENKSANGGSAD